MAYEFKKLSAVEAVETPADTANVLIEEDGVIKKTPSGVFTGGGPFVARVWYSEDEEKYVCDKTFDELKMAADNYLDPVLYKCEVEDGYDLDLFPFRLTRNNVVEGYLEFTAVRTSPDVDNTAVFASVVEVTRGENGEVLFSGSTKLVETDENSGDIFG